MFFCVWQAFNPKNSFKFNKKLSKSKNDVVSLFHKGTTEIKEAIKKANFNNLLSKKEVELVVLEILKFFAKEQIWYKTYLEKNKSYIEISTKQHVQLTQKFYSPI